MLSENAKVSRTHFQYLVSFLHIIKNSAMEDVIIDFLFGFSESKIARKLNYDEKNSKENNKNEKNEDLLNHQLQENLILMKKRKKKHQKKNMRNYLLIKL